MTTSVHQKELKLKQKFLLVMLEQSWLTKNLAEFCP